MSPKLILIWEISGMFFIIVGGSLLHFTFKWSGFWTPAALFSAVNESVWEHLKLGFWPAFLFGLIEAAFMYGRVNNFLLAKGCVLYLIPISIVILYYLYTSVVGHHILFMDILIFVLSVVGAQYMSYRILLTEHHYPVANAIAVLLIIISVAAFSLLSYHPLKSSFFRDQTTGQYGISKRRDL
jgi:hypothetical protein